MSFLHKPSHSLCFCSTTTRTVQGLAYSPAELQHLVEQGRPVTNAAFSEMLTMGTTEQFDEIPLESQRGVDPNDFFNAELDAQDNLERARHKMSKDVKLQKRIFNLKKE